MLDYLFVGAHPDDCEIFCGGSILSLKSQGFRVGILDLTCGEMGSFGSADIRKTELKKANSLMNIDFRRTLDFRDSFLEDNGATRTGVVNVLRETQAKMVVSFPSVCRHPDHRATHQIVKSSVFLAGLKRYPLQSFQRAHRPQAFVCFAEFYPLPHISFVVDISAFYEKKKELVRCYSSQIVDENAVEKKETETSSTFIHSPAFWDDFEGRAKYFGSLAGVRYAEAFFAENPPHLKDPLVHFSRKYV